MNDKMSNELVSVKNVSVEFDYQDNFLSRKQKIQAVKNVNLSIKKELLASWGIQMVQL